MSYGSSQFNTLRSPRQTSAELDGSQGAEVALVSRSMFFGVTPIDLAATIAIGTATALSPTLSVGAVSLSPSVAASTATAIGPSLTLGAVSPSPAQAEATSSGVGPSISLGAVSLSSTVGVGTGSVLDLSLSLTLSYSASVIDAIPTAFGPTLTAGAVSLQAVAALATSSVSDALIDMPVAGFESYVGIIDTAAGAYRYRGVLDGEGYLGDLAGDDYLGLLDDAGGSYRYRGVLEPEGDDDMDQFSMVVGDRSPALTRVLMNGATGTPANLTTASSVTVEFKIRDADGDFGTLKTGTCTFAADATGVATYAWAAGDVDAAGTLWIRFIATFPTAKTQHFPSDGSWFEFPVSE